MKQKKKTSAKRALRRGRGRMMSWHLLSHQILSRQSALIAIFLLTGTLAVGLLYFMLTSDWESAVAVAFALGMLLICTQVI